jgi:photosystem II oxygen-evolving enhancer protein 3
MKIALASCLVASAAAFSQETSRRDAFAGIAAASAALVPVIANAAAGESPRFSVFGLIGDGGAYSEGAAYGTDQSAKLYSPYSVYGEQGPDSLYKEDTPEFVAKKKAILTETKNRLTKIPAYIEKKKWFEVSNELNRYMYETRGAVKFLAKTVQQKEAAQEFFVAIEGIGNNARLKRQDACAVATKKSIEKLDAFVKSL